MNVTVYTDASYCPTTHRAAGAWWATCDHGRITNSVKLHAIRSSTEAELAACLNAAKHVINTWGAKYIDKIYFNTDCMAVVKIFRYTAPHSNKFAKVQKQFSDVTTGIKCSFRHVQAHQRDKSASTWLNNWCDRQARLERTGAVDYKQLYKDLSDRKDKLQ